MGHLALLPVGAAALFAAAALVAQAVTEQRRIVAVEAAVLASGRAGPVEVEPAPGGDCPQGGHAFGWRTEAEAGWACAGPGDAVSLRDARE